MSEDLESNEALPSQEEVTSRRMDEIAAKAELERRDRKKFDDSQTLWMAANGVGTSNRIQRGKEMRRELVLMLNKVISMVPIIENPGEKVRHEVDIPRKKILVITSPEDPTANDKWHLLKKLELLRDQAEILMIPEMIAAGWWDAMNVIQLHCYGEEEWQKKIRDYWENGSIDEVFGLDEREEKKEVA